MEKGVIVDKVIEMYSLYDCDAWRTPSSMSVEYETLERSAMNEKIKEILLGDPKSFELTNYLDSDEQDELNELEETDDDSSKKDNYLDLEIRELDLKKLTVNGGDY